MLDKLLRTAHLAMSPGSESLSASSPPILMEPSAITLNIPRNAPTAVHVDSVPSSVHHSPNSSINLSVPYTPNAGTSNPPSPRLVVPLDTSDMRVAGHSSPPWDFTDYMRMHSDAQHSNTSRSGSGIALPTVTPLYIVPSSQMSAVNSPYGGNRMDSVYASPYPVSPPTGSTSGSYPSLEYHHRHQTTSPTSGDVGHVSWEHFMSSMGL